MPDIIATAKGLGAGYTAIGAVLCREHVYDAVAGGSRRFPLGHTWDGTPLACAVGLAVLEALRSEDLIQRVRTRGQMLRDELAGALAELPMVREVRGHGYLLGVSFVDPRDGESFLPSELRVGGRIDDVAFERGLITLSTQPTRDGYAGDQTLFAPAFTATDDELGQMVSLFAEVVQRVAEDVESELSAQPRASTTSTGVQR
jgi:adenosylmethionine-8-amino-7-oxononanoate aminotransferase